MQMYVKRRGSRESVSAYYTRRLNSWMAIKHLPGDVPSRGPNNRLYSWRACGPVYTAATAYRHTRFCVPWDSSQSTSPSFSPCLSLSRALSFAKIISVVDRRSWARTEWARARNFHECRTVIVVSLRADLKFSRARSLQSRRLKRKLK